MEKNNELLKKKDSLSKKNNLPSLEEYMNYVQSEDQKDRDLDLSFNDYHGVYYKYYHSVYQK